MTEVNYHKRNTETANYSLRFVEIQIRDYSIMWIMG